MAAKKSSVLDAIRRTIHLPLPLNPRQTQQLKLKLASSFKQNLDKEHGAAKGGLYIADVHLENILGSAHFSTPVNKPTSHTSKLQSQPAKKPPTAAERQSALLMTVDQFLQEVATGEATLNSAKKCMLHLQLLGNTPGESGQQQPGQAVYSWLHSTGLAESLEFLHDREFVKLLVYHLYKEQRQSRIQAWYAQSSWTSSSGLRSAIRDLIHIHVRTEAKFRDISSAVELFNNFAAKFTEIKGHTLLQPSARFLAYQLMPVTKPETQLKIGVALHETFVSNVNANLRVSLVRAWYHAVLDLSHPQSPSVDRAMGLLSILHNNLDKFRDQRPESSQRAKFIYLLIITAQRLSAQGRVDDAEKLKNDLLKLALTPDISKVEIERDPGHNESLHDSYVNGSSLLVTLEDTTGQNLHFQT